MKKYFALILSVCLMFTLAACGNSNDSVSSGASSVDTLLDPNADNFNSIGADMPSSSSAAVSSEAESSQPISSTATSRTISAAYKDYSYAMTAAKALSVYDFSGSTKYTVKKDGGIKLYEVILSAKANGEGYISGQTEISKDYQNQSLGKTEELKYGNKAENKSYSLHRATYDLDPDNNDERLSNASYSAPKLSTFVSNATVFSIKENDISSYTERTSDDKTYFKFVIKNASGSMLLQNNFQAIDAGDINDLTVSYFVVTLTTDAAGVAIEYSVTVNCNIDDSNGDYDYTLNSTWKVESQDAASIKADKPDWVK